MFYEAGQRLFTPVPLTHLRLAMAVLGGSALVNLLVSLTLKRAAKRFDSAALDADAAHLSTDVYTSVGALAGLAGYYFTGYALFDTGAALAVGAIIGGVGLKVSHQAVHGLLDTRLPAHEEEAVRQIVSQVTPDLELKEIVSRKAGPVRYLDLTLTVCRWETLEEIHQLCDRLEEEIAARFPGARIFIHPEPCLLHRENHDAASCACPLHLNVSYPIRQ